MAAPAAAIGYGTFIERNKIHLREIDLPIPNLPADLDGLRILQISDIHLSPFLSESTLARAISAAIETKPDLAVVTGDLISTHGDPVDACIRQLARLKAPAGVFGCMGNHEHYAEARSRTSNTRRRAPASNFSVAPIAPRASARLPSNFAGRGPSIQEERKEVSLYEAERMVDPNSFNLLLSHNPDVLSCSRAAGLRSAAARATLTEDKSTSRSLMNP